MKFNTKEFENNKVVIHFNTKEELYNFAEQFKNIYQYTNKISLISKYLEDSWNTYESELCYDYDTSYEGLSYYRKEYYERNNYEILEWSDYMEKEKTYMGKIAEMFNKKLAEVFIIKDMYGEFKFSNNGLLHNYLRGWVDCPEILAKLLSGEYQIDEYKEPEFKIGDMFKLNDRVEVKSGIEGIEYVFDNKYRNVNINLKCILDSMSNDLCYLKCEDVKIESTPLYLILTKQDLSKLKRV